MDQLIEEETKKAHLHNHAIKGDLEEIGAMPLAHDQAENNPHSEKSRRKKKERDAELLHTITQIQEAIDALMDRLNAELDALQVVIEELETEMHQNRLEWEYQADILNQIDDVFCDFEDGGSLDREKAISLLKKADIDIPENATDAQMVTLLQSLRERSIKNVESLDTTYLTLELDHMKFRARENQIIAAKQKLEAIGNNSSLSDEAKLSAIQALDTEVGTKTLHRAATATQDEQVAAKADEVVDINNEYDQTSKTVNITNSINSLNF